MNTKHEIYNHKHIVLANDYFNPLALIRSLGEEGIEAIIVLFGHERNCIRKSKYAVNLTKVDCVYDGIEYILKKYGNEPIKPFLYVCSDDATLATEQNYDRLKDHFYLTNGEGGLVKYMEKYEQNKAAVKCGLRIPKEELLKVGVLPTTLKYPVMTKAPTSATGGNWKGNAFICENEEQLKEAYKKMDVDTILVQEYIVKKNELCIDGISINGGEDVFMPYSCGYYRFSKDSYGGYCNYVVFDNKELNDKIVKLIKEFKFSGIFCIEFLEGNDGEFYFMEVNLRHSGWGYAFTYGGYNLPIRWAKATIDGKIDLSDFKPKQHFTFLAENTDMKVMVDSGRMSIFKWYVDFWRTDSRVAAVPSDSIKYYLQIHKMVVSRMVKTIIGNKMHIYFKAACKKMHLIS